MGLREDIGRKIDKKRAEIIELETQARLAREYLQALEDTLKMLPRESSAETTVTLRPGTSLAKARDALRKAGRPLHITELLAAIGKGSSRNERAGLSGTLAAYVRRGEVFARPAPNTFSLIELPNPADDEPEVLLEPEPEDAPPAGFGKL